MFAPGAQQRRTKIASACVYCRSKKIRCDGDHPCGNCKSYRARCEYVNRQRTKAKVNTDASKASQLTQQGEISCASPISGTLNSVSYEAPCLPAGSSFVFVFESGMNGLGGAQDVPASPAIVPLEGQERLSQAASPHQTLDSMNDEAALHSCNTPCITGLVSPQTSPKSRPEGEYNDNDEEISDAMDEEQFTSEYYGPGSFLSICSRPAIDWVCEKTRGPDFADLAKQLIDSISRRPNVLLNVRQGFLPDAEPGAAEAWKYVRAFFEVADTEILAVVSRASVESRLKTYFDNLPTGFKDDDTAWYALRNAIYAVGARNYLDAQGPSSKFRVGSGHGWGYFKKALAVLTELVYESTSLMSLQAFIVLIGYSESLNCPSLGDLLCSCAMRVAITKGLHRQPTVAMGLGESSIQMRNAIWWTLYVYDRHYAFQWGRPVCIDEQTITAQLPTMSLPGTTFNLDTILPIIKRARVWWQINKKYTRLKIFNAGIEDVAASIADLERRLEQSVQETPVRLHPPDKESPPTVPSRARIVQYLGMTFSYLGALIQIHSILVHPWNGVSLEVRPEQVDQVRKCKSRSNRIVIESSRRILQYLGFIPINAATPKWLCIYYPLTAAINIFIHILQYPELPTVQSDRQLILAVAGHFSSLQFMCADIDISFAAGLSNLSRLTTTEAKPNSIPANHDNQGPTFPALDLAELEFPMVDDDFFTDMMYVEDEQWGTLMTY